MTQSEIIQLAFSDEGKLFSQTEKLMDPSYLEQCRLIKEALECLPESIDKKTKNFIIDKCSAAAANAQTEIFEIGFNMAFILLGYNPPFDQQKK